MIYMYSFNFVHHYIIIFRMPLITASRLMPLEFQRLSSTEPSSRDVYVLGYIQINIQTSKDIDHRSAQEMIDPISIRI